MYHLCESTSVLHADHCYNGAWLRFQKAKVGSCVQCSCMQITGNKCSVKFLPIVPYDKRSCFYQDKWSTVQLPLGQVFALRVVACLTEICKPSIPTEYA